MSPLTKLLRYCLFAVLAIIANLASQRLVLGTLGHDFGLMPALVAGTAVGLVVKYLLDKRWIFEDRSSGLAAHGRRFGLYTAMGGVTTLLFWAVEYGFWVIWRDDALRELGAVIGLLLGYGLKYWLDRRFVFSGAARGAA